MEKTYQLAYDLKLKQPGCVLLQAALGGDSGLAQEFPVELWLLQITPDLKVYTLTQTQLNNLLMRQGVAARDVQLIGDE